MIIPGDRFLLRLWKQKKKMKGNLNIWLGALACLLSWCFDMLLRAGAIGVEFYNYIQTRNGKCHFSFDMLLLTIDFPSRPRQQRVIARGRQSSSQWGIFLWRAPSSSSSCARFPVSIQHNAGCHWAHQIRAALFSIIPWVSKYANRIPDSSAAQSIAFRRLLTLICLWGFSRYGRKPFWNSWRWYSGGRIHFQSCAIYMHLLEFFLQKEQLCWMTWKMGWRDWLLNESTRDIQQSPGRIQFAAFPCRW